MRRRLLWIVALVCLFLPLVPPPALASGAFVQNVVGDGATVAMITPDPTTLNLQVWDPAGGPAREAGPSQGRRHALEVTGLAPERHYRYAVRGLDGAVVDEGAFHTPPRRDDAPVRFLAVGDSGGLPGWIWLQDTPAVAVPARLGWLGPKSQVSAIGEAMARHDPDFWLHMGDVIYPDGEHRHYAMGFFEPFRELLRKAPVYAVLGNHDLHEGSEGRPMLQNLELPTNPITGDERMYSFAYGSVRVIGLDLNGILDPETGKRRPIGADHPGVLFLRRELESVTEPWVVVFSHYPILSASRHKDRPDMQEHVLTLLEEFGVQLYLAGHDHVYQRFGTGRDGPVQVVTGGGGKSLYTLNPHPRLEASAAVYHYTEVEVTGSVLWLRAHGVDGERIDEVRLGLGDDARVLGRLGRLVPERARRIRALR